MITKPKLLLVGCGHMGGAMLHQWLAVNAFSHAHIVKPSPLDISFDGNQQLSWSATPGETPPNYVPDIIILAVRPKDLAAVVPDYIHYNQSLFLSLAAGKKLAQLEALLSPSHALVRAMPNVASEVGAGMTFAISNPCVTTAHKQNTEMLLQAVGDIAWLENENLFDTATALSGCGPGYVFAMIECMAAAGEKLGLPAAFAARLARQTIIGSGALLSKTEKSAADLRKAIDNPGTMTEAALKQLLADKAMPDIMLKAMDAAITRAHELAQ